MDTPTANVEAGRTDIRSTPSFSAGYPATVSVRYTSQQPSQKEPP